MNVMPELVRDSRGDRARLMSGVEENHELTITGDADILACWQSSVRVRWN